MCYVRVGMEFQDDGALGVLVNVSCFHFGVDLPAGVVIERVQAIFCHEQHVVGAVPGGFGPLSYQPLGDLGALPYGEFSWVVGREGAVKRPVRK